MLTRCVEPAEQYLRAFVWNKVKYRADKPLGELIDSLQKVGLWEAVEIRMVADNEQELVGIDNDVKSKYTQYNSIKTTLLTLQRKQT
jgi:V-type H+-transporting ATPase subunit C